jgi:hypothetical protein
MNPPGGMQGTERAIRRGGFRGRRDRGSGLLADPPEGDDAAKWRTVKVSRRFAHCRQRRLA